MIILGPQGSGKGTQAELLREKFGLAFISSGEWMREVAQIDTELGRRVKERIDKGLMVEPEDVAAVVEEKLKQVSPQKGIIVEGFPRSLEQYELMKQFWPKLNRGDYRVIFIELSEEEAVKRLGSRVICENCKLIFITGQFEKCPKCGGKLVQRHDDYPEAVKKRLGWFKSEVLPVIKEIEKDGHGVIRIDGSPTIEEVHEEILEKLGLK